VKQMQEILRQLQVTPVATVGEEFDPRQHEALVLWSGTTFPTSMWRKRFGQDTSCATAC